MAIIRLKPGRQKALQRHHPWIYSGAIDTLESGIDEGETVRIISSKGEFLGWGAFSPYSQIRIRVWSENPEDEIGENFFRQRIQRAISWRRSAINIEQTNAVRLVYGESDGLPGFIVDQYGDILVIQCLSCGAERWRDLLVDLLVEITEIQSVFERSDADIREFEGLSPRVGLLRGKQPPELISIYENGLLYYIDIRHGHKTGFYLDQRDNRYVIRKYSSGREVLDCFSYSGGFTLNALTSGAKNVMAIESSKDALMLLRKNLDMNIPVHRSLEMIEGDVFSILRNFRDRGLSFDMVILDPPKFAPTSSQVERATRAYKDINLLALKLLRPEGILFTFSCSGGVNPELFQNIVRGAALDAAVETQIVGHLDQPVDHPIRLSFPEGSYLKGIIIRKI